MNPNAPLVSARLPDLTMTFGSGQFEWGRRRRIIHVTLLFCLVAAVALIVGALRGMDSPLLSTLSLSVFGLAGSTIGAYVFGAVWDDAGARKAQYDALVAQASAQASAQSQAAYMTTGYPAPQGAANADDLD